VIGRREIIAEFLGTALLLACGLSAAIFNFSSGSPLLTLVPNDYIRRFLSVLLFSASATVIIYSPLGRISGGHINPAVTLAFFRLGKLTTKAAVAYIVAQFAGAVAGTAAVRFVWGARASNVRLGATLPGHTGIWVALGIETLATFLFMSLILTFIIRPRIAHFTAAAGGLFGIFLAFFSFPYSGASLNPARSFGPALLEELWATLWIYFVGPSIGAVAAATLFRNRIIPCGKLFHDSSYTCNFENCLYVANVASREASRPSGRDGRPRRGAQ
jgi:aquaporin Z